MIRKAGNEDYEKLASLWLEVSLKAHDFIAKDYWEKMVKEVRNYYLPNTDTFIFEDKHQIKGFISILENNHIGGLFVATEFQKQKIGTKLLNYLKKRRPNLTLKVFTKNKKALRFYQKNDFKIIVQQTDVSTGEDELVMSWALGCISGFQKRYQGDS